MLTRGNVKTLVDHHIMKLDVPVCLIFAWSRQNLSHIHVSAL